MGLYYCQKQSNFTRRKKNKRNGKVRLQMALTTYIGKYKIRNKIQQDKLFTKTLLMLWGVTTLILWGVTTLMLWDVTPLMLRDVTPLMLRDVYKV